MKKEEVKWFAELMVVSTFFSLLNYFILSFFGFTRFTILLVSEVPALMSIVLFFLPFLNKKRREEI